MGEYEFRSSITDETVSIAIKADDIIQSGELRRIVRDKDGNVPGWVKPILDHQDYIRITPSGRVYGKLGKEVKTLQTSGKYILSGKDKDGKFGSLSLLKALTAAFMPEYLGTPFNDRVIEDGIDITTINRAESKISKATLYGYNSGRLGYITSKDGKRTKSYKVFQSMHERCNKPRNRPTYDGCTVDERFFDYQYFAKWYEDNIYKTQNMDKSYGKIQIDKDIAGDRKLYSPETCLLVPQYINIYFVGANRKSAGTKRDEYGHWLSYCTYFLGDKKKYYIGSFSSMEEAHNAWLFYKNKQLQELVTPFFLGDIMPEYTNHPMALKVIEALRNYEFR